MTACFLAMGVPLPLGGPSSAWDYWPVAGFIGSLWLLRYVVDVRLRWPLVLSCLLLGTIFASVVDAWGISAGLASAMGIALLARLVRAAPHAN
jgi:hypothetical protein